MAQQKSDDVAKSEESSHSDVVTTRVNVALPFSSIKVQEPSADLAELAKLVRALADLVADIAPGPKAQELSKQAKAVAARLQ